MPRSHLAVLRALLTVRRRHLVLRFTAQGSAERGEQRQSARERERKSERASEREMTGTLADNVDTDAQDKFLNPMTHTHTHTYTSTCTHKCSRRRRRSASLSSGSGGGSSSLERLVCNLLACVFSLHADNVECVGLGFGPWFGGEGLETLGYGVRFSKHVKYVIRGVR